MSTDTYNILDKLGSFDQDIRFMGLNDLAVTVASNPGISLDPLLVRSIVNCLGDTSPDVQNQAVKLVASLTMASEETTTNLLEQVLSQKAPEAVRGVALKHIFQSGELPSAIVNGTIPGLLENHKVFQTVEGVDALVELFQSSPISSNAATRLTYHFVHLLSAQNHQLGLLLPIIDALALTIPKIPENVWRDDIQQAILARTEDPLYLSLIGKLSGNIPDTWLFPEAFKSITRNLESALNSRNLECLEALLKTLTSFMTSLPSFRQDHLEQVIVIVEKTIHFREYGDYEDEYSEQDDTQESMDFDADFADDSEWFDESSCIRQAASQLAAVTQDPRCFSFVLDSLSAEQDEASRVVMYKTLASLYPAKCFDSNTPPRFGQICGPLVRKDLSKHRLLAADTGIRLIASLDKAVSADLVKASMQSSRSSVHKYITFLNPELKEVAPEDRTSESADIKDILHSLFEDQQKSGDVPEDTLIQAIRLASIIKFTEMLDRILTILKQKGYSATKIACIEALPSLISRSDASSIDKVLTSELSVVTEQGAPAIEVLTGLTALQGLIKQANEYLYPRHTETILATLSSVSQKYTGNGSTDNKVLLKCCELLCQMPDNVAGPTANKLAEINDPTLVPFIQDCFVSSASRMSQPIALQWAIKNQAMELIVKIGGLPSNFKNTLSECLEKSDSPEVHAAAASSVSGGWADLGREYLYNDTDFKDLNEKQLRLLLALAQRRCRWDWYSLDVIEHATTNEIQSQVFGSITAITSGAAAKDAHRFVSLGEPLTAIAFTAYIKQLRDPSTILEVMDKFPELQSASAAAVAIPNRLMFEEFARRFADKPSFVINTMKIVNLPDMLSVTWPVLAEYVKSESNDSSIRSDALATIRWILQSPDPVPHEDLENALGLASSVMIPDKQLVQTVSIGPFKHKVDPSAVLRQTALETLYTCLIPNVSSISSTLQNKLVSLLVNYNIKDDEHDVKVMAYRLLSQYAELNPDAIRPFVPKIEDALTEFYNHKLKDTAVKQDVEKHADLMQVIQETRRKISRLS